MQIQTHADTLISNINDIKVGMAEVFQLTERRVELQTELAEIRSALDRILVPELDDQLFFTLTGYVRVTGRTGCSTGPPFRRSGH